ncbi:MAG: DUF447 family protein [Methanomicrobiaceae archaeon]|nr:DUF447 family protein [Methanomicrobiaceae archaeon]
MGVEEKGNSQGILREGINEVIATTRNNAAPMGIINRKDRHSLVLFRGSHTAENVLREGWLVANIIHDPVIYVRCAFDDPSIEAFAGETVHGIPMQRLRDAEAWVAFLAAVEHESGESLVVRLTPLREEVVEARIYPVNRGFSSVIEATVHATRYLLYRDEKLRELIDHHLSIARKCGGEREWEAVEMLEGYLERGLE